MILQCFVINSHRILLQSDRVLTITTGLVLFFVDIVGRAIRQSYLETLSFGMRNSCCSFNIFVFRREIIHASFITRMLTSH